MQINDNDILPVPADEQAAPSIPAAHSHMKYNVSAYLKNSFDTDVLYFQKYKDRKTGFDNIDEYLTLYPGLACLTGATSLGKTSFCVQLADQLLEKGETVLYFTLEQNRLELVTKSLARYLRKQHPDTSLNNIDIKNGSTSPELEAVKQYYLAAARNFFIYECDFTITAPKIIEAVESFISETGIRPIVFIDYLQIIAPSDERLLDDRKRIDDAVKRFKRMSRKNEIFVMMISNMARSSYREKISEDSFKESGLIEYTCDYLFGLQLTVLEDDSFFTREGARGGQYETSKSEKQLLIDEASAAMPKKIVFKALKNRNGKKVFRAFFEYYPDYDYFEPLDHEDDDLVMMGQSSNPRTVL